MDYSTKEHDEFLETVCRLNTIPQQMPKMWKKCKEICK